MPVINARFVTRRILDCGRMEAFVVVLVALVMLGVGAAALVAARRLRALEPGPTDEKDR